MVYNVDTQTLKTVFSFSLFEPELGLNRTASRIVSTSAASQAEFLEFLNYLATQRYEKTYEYDFPATGPNGATSWSAIADTPSLVQQMTLARMSGLSESLRKNTSIIIVTFQNGDKVYIGRTGIMSLANFPILFVTDSDGNLLGIFAGNGTTIQNFNGGAGTQEGYTDFLLVSGGKICFGECPVRDGIIIIERVIP